jgi:hypothetical protein
MRSRSNRQREALWRGGVDVRSAEEALLEQLRSGEIHVSVVAEPDGSPIEPPAQAAA